MTDLLLRLFVKHASDTSDPAVRAGYGRLAGVTGIVCNLLLFALKLLAGTISGSVSITADAVNNLSDASGSIVTLVGFKLASRPADNEHPYGHARMEYLSGLAVAVLILVIGVAPLLDAASISITFMLLPSAIALQDAHSPQGLPSTGCSQLTLFAKSFAILVLPVPLVPQNK